MPFEHALWRIDRGLTKLPVAALEREATLEDHIHADISILNDAWMIIGRQIRTDYGGFIDLLAIDRSGALIVIELKKDLTPSLSVSVG
jgi:RecB family endonuclease NucS